MGYGKGLNGVWKQIRGPTSDPVDPVTLSEPLIEVVIFLWSSVQQVGTRLRAPPLFLPLSHNCTEIAVCSVNVYVYYIHVHMRYIHVRK